MKVLMVEPGKSPYAAEIESGLKSLQAAVGGDIQAVYPYEDPVALICNEEGKLMGLPLNRALFDDDGHIYDIVSGNFLIVGLGEDDVKAKFPAMYNAFCYGAPPHAGIAPGVDRMVMLIAGEESIREIIPFPMNKNAQDVMMGAPATVTEKQLREVHIQIVEDKAEEKKDDAQ